LFHLAEQPLLLRGVHVAVGLGRTHHGADEHELERAAIGRGLRVRKRLRRQPGEQFG
jgi:hypothetical protein